MIVAEPWATSAAGRAGLERSYASPVRRFLFVAAACLPGLLPAQEMRTGEEITVERVLVDARVTNYGGEPVLGLTPADFDVKIDGKPAGVESVEWIPETAAARFAAGIDEEEYASQESGAPKGRLFVYFIQTDFARNKARISGQMKFLSYAGQMIDGLETYDRVAVFSFDSHLKFRLDFSDDKSEIKEAIHSAILIDDPPPPQVVANPSLARRLDRDAMNRATSPDEALILVGNALRHIPGPKSMILFGWGMGILSNGRVVMHHKYPIARRSLESARVTVFALDMTDADYHDLEIGLGKAAADTGGFYAKTHIFPKIAVDRLERTLAGHYELEVRKPPTEKRGAHTIEVRVRKKGTHVLARTSYVDRAE